eukprot:5022799-Amphidinium_carterae.1
MKSGSCSARYMPISFFHIATAAAFTFPPPHATHSLYLNSERAPTLHVWVFARISWQIHVS